LRVTDTITMTITSPCQTRTATVRVVDGMVTLRPSEGEPMRWPAELLDGATLFVDGATSLPADAVVVPATPGVWGRVKR
jgi:hypothetical protein